MNKCVMLLCLIYRAKFNKSSGSSFRACTQKIIENIPFPWGQVVKFLEFLYCITSPVPSYLSNRARISHTTEYYLVVEGETGRRHFKCMRWNRSSVGKMVRLLTFLFHSVKYVEMTFFYSLANLLVRHFEGRNSKGIAKTVTKQHVECHGLRCPLISLSLLQSR